MEVKYASEHLNKLCHQKKYALKHLEEKVAKKLIANINYCENAAESLLDIKQYTAFHFHDLNGKEYENQWVIYVGRTGYRIHFIPLDENGNEIKKGEVIPQIKSIKIMRVMEVSNHYGE